MRLALLDPPWWGYVLVTLALTHVTIAAVTIFLHRHQAHRALGLHPVASHFFRFWLWLTTGMATREWVSIHRKHHARSDTAEDPHSPQIYGIRKVLFEGTELYRMEISDAATIGKFGRGTPDDWIERHVYAKHGVLGVAIMLVIDLGLFGPIGLTVWAVQMLWIPFFAAGVVNGVGHYWGYRNFAPDDASRNISPWGFLIGGEELHNNHHAYITSARFSIRWWEFDIGWMYIRILELLHLAKVRKVAPKIRFEQAKTPCDMDTLQSVITHRYAVLAQFDKCSTRHAALGQAIESSRVLGMIHSMRQELAAVWSRPTASKEQLVRQLEDWCLRAEHSGITAVQEFSRRLRCYA
jgi:stearoyl-CoA desaturase (delta-9 desaturase)